MSLCGGSQRVDSDKEGENLGAAQYRILIAENPDPRTDLLDSTTSEKFPNFLLSRRDSSEDNLLGKDA